MPINLLVIPQVIPRTQYLEHLDGASTSSENTVRLFASLSLARLHPDVTSWAAAAEALNIPGPMGVRCARACSATMLITADEWKSRIWRAGEETEQRDYRATEAKIYHRLGMTRWFNQWAHRNRPDARYGDHDLALTWQWSTSPTPTSSSHPPGGEGSRPPRTAPATASSSRPSPTSSNLSSHTPFTNELEGARARRYSVAALGRGVSRPRLATTVNTGRPALPLHTHGSFSTCRVAPATAERA